ncbi:flagellar basal body-associated FliL family protein [Succinivibrio sp.]|uniref:flagellar basal body-associated FliL family protein n=1 Tax=Succinivibrio sp. TaxID=2053619 RepID=UPI0038642C15
MIKNFLAVAFSIFTLFATPYAYAGHGPKEEPKEEVPAEPEVGYYTIKEITTNLANLNPRDRLHYIQIKVGLMLEDSRDAAIIADIEPLLKDIILTILGNKEFSQVATNEARERIRVECREKILSTLKDKFGKSIVSDVLFLSYLYQ